MKFTIYHNKVYYSVLTDEEYESLKKSLRIWYRDHRGGLRNHILIDFRDKSFPSGYLDSVISKLKKNKIFPIIDDKRTYPAPKINYKRRGRQK